MSDSVRNSGPRPAFGWILWWRIDPKTLRKQVSQYAALPFYLTSRGQSAMLMWLSAAGTLIMALVTRHYLSLVDATAFLGLSIFMLLGQRWSMIAAMVLWTLEKAVQLLGAVLTHAYATPLVAVIWWTIYMHSFYLAWRVEGARRETAAVAVGVFD